MAVLRDSANTPKVLSGSHLAAAFFIRPDLDAL